jgi:hypothetical protein
MKDATRDRLTILNAFVHDVATGTWLSSLILLSILHFETRGTAWLLARPLVPPLERKFMVLTWASLGVILVTGMVRMWTFRAFGWTGDVARERIQLLKVKHAVLGVAFLAGTIYQVMIVYR